MMSHSQVPQALAFQFKGGLLPLTILELYDLDLTAVQVQLANKVKQAPAFFQRTPVVMGLDRLTDPTGLDLLELKRICVQHGLMPMAVRGGGEALREAAHGLGMAWFPPASGNESAHKAVAQAPAANEARPASSACTIIEQPVRSGQQVHAPVGDLIILGAVNEGAEVLADGNIHVYGSLRGRALAGINGNREARIFCRSLEADLISVAGRYKTYEDFHPDQLRQPVQAQLREERLEILRI